MFKQNVLHHIDLPKLIHIKFFKKFRAVVKSETCYLQLAEVLKLTLMLFWKLFESSVQLITFHILNLQKFVT